MIAKYDYIQSFSVHIHIPYYLVDSTVHFFSNYMLT